MKIKNFILLIALSIPIISAASIFPQPTIIFDLKNNSNKEISIIEQFQCSDKLCTDPKPLANYGISKINCDDTTCISKSYKYLPYQQIKLSFNDGETIDSNVFNSKKNILQKNSLIVTNSKVEVLTYKLKTINKDQKNIFLKGFLLALFLTVMIKFLSGWFYLNTTNILHIRILITMAILTTATTILSWFLLSELIFYSAIHLLIIFIIETFGIYFLNSNKINLKQSAGLSFIMGVFSFTFGMMLSFMIASF